MCENGEPYRPYSAFKCCSGCACDTARMMIAAVNFKNYVKNGNDLKLLSKEFEEKQQNQKREHKKIHKLSKNNKNIGVRMLCVCA